MGVWTCAIHGPTSSDCQGCDDELIALTEESAFNWPRELAEAMDAADESDEARWATIDALDVEEE